jgi:hypothetical protein
MSVSLIEPDNPSNPFDGNFKLLHGVNWRKRDTDRRVLSQCTKLLPRITHASGITLMIASHNPDIASVADPICRSQAGQLFISSTAIIFPNSHFSGNWDIFGI